MAKPDSNVGVDTSPTARVQDHYININGFGVGYIASTMMMSEIEDLMKLIQKEHPIAHRRRKLCGLRIDRIGTGYLYRYEIQDAFPHDPLYMRDTRVAFCHLDGIIWDRSCRFVDPGATA